MYGWVGECGSSEVGPAGLTYVRSQDTGTILLPYWWVGSGTGSVSITGEPSCSLPRASHGGGDCYCW